MPFSTVLIERFLLFIGIMVCIQVAHAQSGNRIDSLKLALANREGLKKIELLIALAREYHNVNHDYLNALDNISQAKELSIIIRDSNKMVQTSRMKAQILSRMEKVDESLHELYFALPIARRLGSNSELMYLTSLIGSKFTLKADYDKALLFLEESLALRREMGDQSEISNVLVNIGVVFYKMKFYHRALKYFEESLNIKKQIKDYWDYEIVLINAGMCHAYLKNYKEALVLLNEGLALSREAGTDDRACSGYYGLGIVYLGLDDLARAQHNFTKSFKLSIENDLTRFQAENQLYLGKISFTKGKKQAGVDQLLYAEKISYQYEYNELLLSVYEELISMFKSLNNQEQLLVNQQKYIVLREKVYNAALIENLAELESKLKAQENTNTLRQQQQLLSLNEELVDKQRLLIVSASCISILLSVVLYMLYYSNKVSKQLSLELERKVTQRTQGLEVLIKSLVENQEEQKENIENVRVTVLRYVGTLKGLYWIMDVESGIKQQLKVILDKLSETLFGDFIVDNQPHKLS